MLLSFIFIFLIQLILVEMVAIKKTSFGSFTDPKTHRTSQVEKFLLKNNQGVEVEILNYGATIAAIRCPDKNGRIADIVLGYDTFQEYLANNNPYFGAVVGRVANRIGGAKFLVDGKEFTVAANRPPNALHGGIRGFDKVIWNSSIQGSSVVLTYLSVDGEEGYPGDLIVSATYSLSEEGELKLEMKATTTKATPINLTNHSYFNLAGHAANKSAVYEHVISVNADKYTLTDNESIPTGQLAEVGGTLWDLRIPRRLGDLIPLIPGGGYDQNLCITQTAPDINFVARVVHPESSRSLEVYSNQPGVQLYTAIYFPKDTSHDQPDQLSAVEEPLIGKCRANYYQHGAFCLETQNYPDAVNHANFPNSILRPGDTYNHVVVYKVGIFQENAPNAEKVTYAIQHE